MPTGTSDRPFLLNSFVKQRVYFDPANKQHLAELKFFMDNSKWKTGCPFYLEQPFIEIPAMCAQRFLAHKLK